MYLLKEDRFITTCFIHLQKYRPPPIMNSCIGCGELHPVSCYSKLTADWKAPWGKKNAVSELLSLTVPNYYKLNKMGTMYLGTHMQLDGIGSVDTTTLFCRRPQSHRCYSQHDAKMETHMQLTTNNGKNFLIYYNNEK
jgi:hypothetical protein